MPAPALVDRPPPRSAAPPPPTATPPPARTTGKRYHGVTTVTLPPPEQLGLALGAALSERRSCRRFTAAPLSAAQLATLLQSAYGSAGEVRLGEHALVERPVPSAGGLYPLELYCLLDRVDGIAPGIYHYAAAPHRLDEVRGPLPRPAVSGLFADQTPAARSSVVIVLTGVLSPALSQYGERGYRYLLLEAGHVAQNLGLVAAALGLGSLALGSFADDPLAAVLGLDIEQEVPLYGIAVGHPATQDRSAVRMLENDR